MTTGGVALGGIAITLSTGVGAELRRPLGIAMVAAFYWSAVLTLLFTTPVIYLLFDRLSL